MRYFLMFVEKVVDLFSRSSVADEVKDKKNDLTDDVHEKTEQKRNDKLDDIPKDNYPMF